MDVPTCENKYVEKTDLPSSQYIQFSASVDDRGRISIPSKVSKKLTDGYVVLGYIFLDKIIYTSVPIRSKNRISIPSFVRRTLAINASDRLDLFLLASDKILIADRGEKYG